MSLTVPRTLFSVKVIYRLPLVCTRIQHRNGTISKRVGDTVGGYIEKRVVDSKTTTVTL